MPRAVGSGQLPTPVAGKASYVDGQLASGLSAGFGPQTLLDKLPATLQPGSTLFYYNPREEDLLLQQAALGQTGKASFLDGLSYDSKQNLSTTQQEKEILYRNALDYAQANGLQLGTALTQTQVNALDRPMLWYVEQTVPDPSCTATGVATCPTLTALMPQVYLPANTSAMSAGGNIVGTDVTLNFGQGSGGSILNTGSITASGTLTVNTDSLTNRANVVDVGEIWNKVSGGYLKVTGTQVQPGGFMSAADMDLNVQTIANIGGILQQLNADGTVDQAGTQQLLANLQAQLGGNFTQVTEADHLHTDFVKEGGMGVVGQVIGMVITIVATYYLGPIGGALVGSMASQMINNGSIDLKSVATSVAIAAVTYGLDGGFSGGAASNATSAAATAAGESAFSTTLSQVGSAAVTAADHALISAGISTVINGGSFGESFKTGLIGGLAAAGANAIGNYLPGIGSAGADLGTEVGNVVAHAALGCATQSALGGDCAGGAIGGATSAVVAPLVGGGALGIQTDADRADPMNQALVTAVAMLAGGGLAAALGQNATAAAGAAQNEALNNYLSPKDRLAFEKAKRECANGVWSSCAAANIYAERDQKTNDILADGLTKCEGSSCQSLANWIQDQKTSLGCGVGGGSNDCQVLDKSWQIAQAKAQGLELPTFSPDDLIGTGLIKGLVTGTLKGVGLTGITRSLAENSGLSGVTTNVLDNIAASQAARANSNFSQYIAAEGKLQEALGIWPPNSGGYAPVYNTTLGVGTWVDRYGYPGGSFVSPLGASFDSRALPSSYLTTKPYFEYQVLQPISGVTEAKILPWFGQPGRGTQFQLPNPVQWYIDNGYLEKKLK